MRPHRPATRARELRGLQEDIHAASRRRPSGLVALPHAASLTDENQGATFGFFDGTLDELERNQAEADDDERRASIDGFFEGVLANRIHEIVESLVVEPAASSEPAS